MTERARTEPVVKRIAERTGRHCLLLPSNRLGLYLALRHWCTPGQRLLMSPISADEILFLVLAAGLRPVIAPLSRRDGNIDASRVNRSPVALLPGRAFNQGRIVGRTGQRIREHAIGIRDGGEGRGAGGAGAVGMVGQRQPPIRPPQISGGRRACHAQHDVQIGSCG